MKIVICGSSFFQEKMVEFKRKLAELGHEPVIHPDYEAFVRGEKQEIWNQMQTEHAEVKKANDYIRWYYNAITNSDAILVLNLEKKGIPNYIGGNTLMEIAFAHCNGKKVFLLNPVPEGLSYVDEIKAMYDEVLNGDLSKISPEDSGTKDFSLKKLALEVLKIEEELGITFDDVLNKLTQEFGELNDAIQKHRGRFCRKKEEGTEHIKEELGDVMINLISLCEKVNVNPDDLPMFAHKTFEKFLERKETYRENLR